MKKVLILAYDFPPYVSVGGIRPFNWFKYLKKYGVEPIVITRQWQNKFKDYRDYIADGESKQVLFEENEYGLIIKAPYKANRANRILLKYGKNKFRLLRRGISAYYEFAQFLWNTGPKINLYNAARDFLKHNKVDVIIATGDPFILFKYAKDLSREFKTPWIADYRDPWTHNNNKNYFPLIDKWFQRCEKKIVRTAAEVVSVDEFIENRLKEYLPGLNYRIIRNGFDPEAAMEAQDIQQSNKEFSVAFAGTINKWAPIESFLRVCNDFISETNAPLKINFYGIDRVDIVNTIVNDKLPGLKNVVEIYPRIPNHELLHKLARNNLFLVFNCYSIIGTKIYDYLALKRLMLFCYVHDEEGEQLKKEFYHIHPSAIKNDLPQVNFIKHTNSGILVENASHLKDVLKTLYAEFLETGKVSCDSKYIEDYSRLKGVQQLAESIKLL